MKPLVPDEPWKEAGIFGPARIRGLLFSRPAEALVALVSVEVSECFSVERLYFRRLPEEIYRQVPVRQLWDSQQDAHCCDGVPFLVFNEFRYRQLRPDAPDYVRELLKGKMQADQGWGGDWLGIRRYDLVSGEDTKSIGRENDQPAPALRCHLGRPIA